MVTDMYKCSINGSYYQEGQISFLKHKLIRELHISTREFVKLLLQICFLGWFMKEMYLIGDRRKLVIIYEKYKYAYLTTAEEYYGDNSMIYHNSTAVFVADYLK